MCVGTGTLKNLCSPLRCRELTTVLKNTFCLRNNLGECGLTSILENTEAGVGPRPLGWWQSGARESRWEASQRRGDGRSASRCSGIGTTSRCGVWAARAGSGHRRPVAKKRGKNH